MSSARRNRLLTGSRVTAIGICVGTLLGLSALLWASDRPKNPMYVQSAAQKPKFTDIPEGAIKIPLLNVEQPDGISCGAASLLSICLYFGVGEESIREFKKKVRTDRVNGTSYHDMVSYAHELGLDATPMSDMTPEQLEAFILSGKPVICSIQAYGNPKDYDRNDKDNGHYVVAIGFDKENFYFMDPSVPAEHRRRGFIPKAELVGRWHDDEAKRGEPAEIINQLGIVLHPKMGHTAFLVHAMRIP